MSVTAKKVEVLRFEYHQEKEDPDYGSCVWANFDFDTENYNLSISSDCGFYGHGWYVTRTESFMELMARITKEYLLNKLCRESLVDWKRTKEDILKALDEADIEDGERNDAISDLEDLEEYNDETDIGYTTKLIEEWNSEHAGIPDIWEYVRTDYTGDEKKIVSVFEKHIQPIIRKFLKDEEEAMTRGGEA